jgi:hypothetical protein
MAFTEYKNGVPKTQPLGHAETFCVEGDEDGFELHFSTDQGVFVVNVHGVIDEFIKAGGVLVDYMAEGALAAAQHRADMEQRDAYDLRNPKHPDWHSVHADLWDSREGK